MTASHVQTAKSVPNERTRYQSWFRGTRSWFCGTSSVPKLVPRYQKLVRLNQHGDHRQIWFLGSANAGYLHNRLQQQARAQPHRGTNKGRDVEVQRRVSRYRSMYLCMHTTTVPQACLSKASSLFNNYALVFDQGKHAQVCCTALAT